MQVVWDLGVGTDYSYNATQAWQTISNPLGVNSTVKLTETTGATWYITGVQLEVGSVATPFERRPFGAELVLCQRYYYRISTSANAGSLGWGFATTTSNARVITPFPVQMRTNPTAVEQTGTASDYRIAYLNTSTNATSVPTFANASNMIGAVNIGTAASLTAGDGIGSERNANTAFLGWSAEL